MKMKKVLYFVGYIGLIIAGIGLIMIENRIIKTSGYPTNLVGGLGIIMVIVGVISGIVELRRKD